VRGTTISFPKSNSRHIDLGDVSGIELRHRLKEANIFVPVIYITRNENPALHFNPDRADMVRPLRAALKRDHRIDGEAGNHVFEQGDSSAYKC
jgi:hypothetical protein